jgi:hypothetical protein
MGTLGTYLSSAREALGLDLHDAAQQTRINVHYLKAMEEEDFSKLPGEVFIKGFLKNYGRFLKLPEAEVLKRYGALKPEAVSPSPAAPSVEQKVVAYERKKTEEVSLEPFVWGAGIFIAIIIFLFTSLPGKHGGTVPPVTTVPTGGQRALPAVPGAKPDKLYLEIVALEDVWLLVRIDSSPQKKDVLKKGEHVTWSADERFLLSYGSIGAVKLLLNGRELTVTGPKSAVVRDLTITAAGVINQNLHVEQPRTAAIKPQPKPSAQPGPAAPSASPQINLPGTPAPAPATPAPTPAPRPDSF